MHATVPPGKALSKTRSARNGSAVFDGAHAVRIEYFGKARRQSAQVRSSFFTFGRIARNLRPPNSFSKRRLTPSMKEIVMTDIDNLNLPPEPPLRQTEPEDEQVRYPA